MKLFVSWSGRRSYEVAVAIRDWVPLALHAVRPFVSSVDIGPGSRWQSRIEAELALADFGLVCVTLENQASPWLNFEAGALSSALANHRVVPLAVDLRPGQINGPLSQFQAQTLSRQGFQSVIGRMNETCDSPIDAATVSRSVDKWWPDLECALRGQLQIDEPAERSAGGLA
jgi:TIR domain